jgi:hypothetical protein
MGGHGWRQTPTSGRCSRIPAQIISHQLIAILKTSKDRACHDGIAEISTWSLAVASRAATHVQKRHVANGAKADPEYRAGIVIGRRETGPVGDWK